MKHEVIIANEATLLDQEAAVVCDLARSAPGPISLGLILLDQGLVDQTILRSSSAPWVLRIQKSDAAPEIQLHRYGERRLEATLGEIALKLLIAYFLRYYRDGQATVDHLDLEGAWSTGGACDLTIKVGIANPPVSEDEARMRIGLTSR